MERWCPNCGRLNSRWPQVVMILAFSTLLMLLEFDSLRKYIWVFGVVLLASLLAFYVGYTAAELRNGGERSDESSSTVGMSTKN